MGSVFQCPPFSKCGLPLKGVMTFWWILLMDLMSCNMSTNLQSFQDVSFAHFSLVNEARKMNFLDN